LESTTEIAITEKAAQADHWTKSESDCGQHFQIRSDKYLAPLLRSARALILRRGILWRLSFWWRHVRRPGHAGLRLVFYRLARNGGNSNEMITGRALNLPSCERLIALQPLIAVRTGKFEFAHEVFIATGRIIGRNGGLVQLFLP